MVFSRFQYVYTTEGPSLHVAILVCDALSLSQNTQFSKSQSSLYSKEIVFFEAHYFITSIYKQLELVERAKNIKCAFDE
jgi:hypothetical protein